MVITIKHKKLSRVTKMNENDTYTQYTVMQLTSHLAIQRLHEHFIERIFVEGVSRCCRRSRPSRQRWSAVQWVKITPCMKADGVGNMKIQETTVSPYSHSHCYNTPHGRHNIPLVTAVA